MKACVRWQIVPRGCSGGPYRRPLTTSLKKTTLQDLLFNEQQMLTHVEGLGEYASDGNAMSLRYH